MSWTSKLITTLAVVVLPAKVISKGVDNVKQEFKEEVDQYLSKMKILVSIGSVFLFFLFFVSATLALTINYFSQSAILGFGVVSSIYFVILIILFLIYRKDIIE